VEFGYTSEIFIQIFEDEQTFWSGVPALHTIEYDTACYDTIPPGIELGTVTLVGYQALQGFQELTFEYMPSDDPSYADIVIDQPGTRGLIEGVLDDDDEAYIAVFDAKGGKRCKGSKRSKRSKRRRSAETPLFEQTIVADRTANTLDDLSSEVLIQIFED
jgi:hypothetical protein